MMFINYYLLSNRRDGKGNQRQLGRYRSFKPAKRTLENRDLNEKLHFYHIKPKSKSNNPRPNTGFKQMAYAYIRLYLIMVFIYPGARVILFSSFFLFS